MLRPSTRLETHKRLKFSLGLWGWAGPPLRLQFPWKPTGFPSSSCLGSLPARASPAARLSFPVWDPPSRPLLAPFLSPHPQAQPQASSTHFSCLPQEPGPFLPHP